MLVIRLTRVGRRNTAQFRIVLQEKSQAPKSASKEILGSYNPHGDKREDQIELKEERIKYWLSQGAQPSNTVHNMLVEFKIIDAPKRRSVQPKLKKKDGEEEGGAPAEGGDAKPADAPKTEDSKPQEKPAEKAEDKSDDKEAKKDDEKK